MTLQQQSGTQMLITNTQLNLPSSISPSNVVQTPFSLPTITRFSSNTLPRLKEQGLENSGSINENPFVSLFPELSRSQTPPWLVEGLRLLYDVKSATLPDVVGQKSTSGAGLVQFDIVAIEPDRVVASSKLYLDITLYKNYHPSIIVPVYGHPGAGDYWIHPNALINAEKVATKELVVVRMPSQVGGVMYQAVRFQYQSGNAKYVWMFDEKSGLLIYYSHEILMNDGSRNSAIVSFIGQRKLAIPWTTASLPAGINVNQTTNFSGGYSVTPLNTPPTTLPFSIIVQISQVGKRYVEYKLIPSSGDLPGLRVTGINQLFDRMWLPINVLNTLSDGQVIDKDPYINNNVIVSKRPGMVLLIETGSNYKTWMGYDSITGKLVYTRQDLESNVVKTSLELQSK